MIYFIQAGLNGPIKIGYTSVPIGKRLHNLQIANPHTLYLVGLENGDKGREREIQSMHIEALMRGEWFGLNDKLANQIWGEHSGVCHRGVCCISHEGWQMVDTMTGDIVSDKLFDSPEAALQFKLVTTEQQWADGHERWDAAMNAKVVPLDEQLFVDYVLWRYRNPTDAIDISLGEMNGWPQMPQEIADRWKQISSYDIRNATLDFAAYQMGVTRQGFEKIVFM